MTHTNTNAKGETMIDKTNRTEKADKIYDTVSTDEARQPGWRGWVVTRMGEGYSWHRFFRNDGLSQAHEYADDCERLGYTCKVKRVLNPPQPERARQ